MDSDKEVWDDFFPFFIVKKWILAKSGFKFKFSISRALKICSERALEGRKGKPMLIKPPQKSLTDKSVVLEMCFFPSLCAHSANAEGIYR